MCLTRQKLSIDKVLLNSIFASFVLKNSSKVVNFVYKFLAFETVVLQQNKQSPVATKYNLY